MTWETVIGLEVHAQLSTQSKLFSNAPTKYGALPNAQTNYVDAGLPGVLPVLNQRAVEMAVQFGLAIDAKINNHSYFERKNYFYPDLPKGYQISQFQRPIVSQGHLTIQLTDGSEKIIHIDRAHLEEDAGKSLHDTHSNYTGIDLNRAGTPLLEIVTAPCMYSAEEAICYLKTLHQLVRFLGICDGNMQEGSFRCDVNLSLRKKGQKELGTRTEIKNINSFRFIEKAILFEQLRHQDMLESGQRIIQETRLYDADKNITESMRTKENENDYRYFPDPDLLPIQISETELTKIKNAMPSLPATIIHRLKSDDLLSDEHIDFLLTSPVVLAFYDGIKQNTTAPAKTIMNWLKGSYSAALNERGLSFDHPLIPIDQFACLLTRLNDGKLSNNTAKQVFNQMLTSSNTVDEIIQMEGLNSVQDDTKIEEIIRKIMQRHPQQVADFQAGKEKLLGFFVGQVMKEMKGQADATQVNRLVIQCLSV